MNGHLIFAVFQLLHESIGIFRENAALFKNDVAVFKENVVVLRVILPFRII
jgi:hypothetical protein